MGHQYPYQEAIATQAQGQTQALVYQWLIYLTVLITVSFFSASPSWGAGYRLDVSSGNISGYAKNIPLGVVMDELAIQGEFTIYLDEKLLATPTTFYLPAELSAERAIQRMVHPHSYAMVFTKVPDRKTLKIDEIKVYAKGNPSATYVAVVGNRTDHTLSPYSRDTSTPSRNNFVSSVQTGRQALRHQVKPPVIKTKSAMGYTGFQFKDRHRGPDYRRDAMAMAQGYAQYRHDRKALELRAQDARLQSAKEASENRRNAYRTQRLQSIQHTINNSIY